MSKHGMAIEFDLPPGRRCNLKMPDRQFAVNVKEDDGKRIAEMLLYDVIGQDWMGEGLTAKRFEDELKAMGEVDEINILINSPGGIIYEALGIYNALVRHPAKVTTQNVGAAWSCAGWILQAGDERLSAENATTMIHNSQGGVFGDRRDFLKEAEVLDKMDEMIAATFSKRTGRKVDTFRKMMDEESWFTGAEALNAKLIDRVVPAKSGPKNLDPRAFGLSPKNAPEEVEEPTDIDEEDEPAGVTEVDVRLRLLELEAG